jgi:hypothetical protein
MKAHCHRSLDDKVWRPSTGPCDNQQLLLEEKVLGNDRLCATRVEKFRGGGEQVDEKNDHFLHGGAGQGKQIARVKIAYCPVFKRKLPIRDGHVDDPLTSDEKGVNSS